MDLEPGSGEELYALEDEVKQINGRRREAAEGLIDEGKPLREIVEATDNDYTPLETLYRKKTGGELISNPYDSVEHEVPITKSCSIVIPAYNNSDRLATCLRSIQESTFNAKYPGLLEVVVVDDGSTKEDIAQIVSQMGLEDLTVRVYRQTNGRIAKARYSGVLHAQGEIVIMPDPDLVLTPSSIEEYMKRHEVLDNTVCCGFMSQIDANDPRLKKEAIAEGSLTNLPIDITKDNRVKNEGFADADWLKKSGHNSPLPIDVGEERFYGWTLASISWGALISAKREDLLRTFAGYDERYVGYGAEDEDMVSRLIALGRYVVPSTGSMSYHQRHPINIDESKRAVNVEVLKTNYLSALKQQDPEHPQQTDAELRFEKKNPRNTPREAKKTEPVGLEKRGAIELRMGLYSQAIKTLTEAIRQDPENYWTAYDLASAQIALAGEENIRSAIGTLEGLLKRDKNSWVFSTLGHAYGLIGDYEKCRSYYESALKWDSSNERARMFQVTAQTNKDRGTNNLQKGKPREALYYLNAALAQYGEQANPWALFDKAVALERIGDLGSALRDLKKVAELIRDNSWVYSRLGMVLEKLGKIEEAKQHFQTSLKMDSQNSEAIEGLKRLA